MALAAALRPTVCSRPCSSRGRGRTRSAGPASTSASAADATEPGGHPERALGPPRPGGVPVNHAAYRHLQMRLLPLEILSCSTESGRSRHLRHEYLSSRRRASLQLRGLCAFGGAHLAPCARWTAEREQLRPENRGIMRADDAA